MNQDEFLNRVGNVKIRLYKIAYMYLNDEQSALDAVQEAIYLALKSLRKLKQTEYFKTWITRILINECLKELRHRKRIHFIDDFKTVLKGSYDYNYDNLPLKEAIKALPNNLKSIVILKYFCGYTLEETSQFLNIPLGTVATRHRKSLGILKLNLKEEDNYE
ncbi:sigma-70 family RNA polymerase sigma factor [Sedimentibacter sp. zth1]|nr:sigma-70 family RNA polymerase sigma factor [Sedimentibacter sp. zth1]